MTSVFYFNLSQHDVNYPQGKLHDERMTGSTAQDTGVRYGSLLVVLDDGPSCMVKPENAGISTTMDVQRAAQLFNKGAMPKIQ